MTLFASGAFVADIDEDMIRQSVMESLALQRREGRADTSIRSPKPTLVQRALVRQYFRDVFETVGVPLQYDTLSDEYRTDTRNTRDVERYRYEELVNATAFGLGLVEENGWIWGMDRAARTDTRFAGEGITIRAGVVQEPVTDNVLIETLPLTTIGMDTQFYKIRTSKLEGSAVVHKPGSTNYGSVNWQAGTTSIEGTTLLTTSTESWENMIFGGSSVLNDAEQNAAAANLVLTELLEDVTRDGHEPTKLNGIRQLAVITKTSKIDYSPGSSNTIGEKYSDVIRMMRSVRRDNNYRGRKPNTAWVPEDLLEELLPEQNFDAGGSTTGGELFALLSDANPQLGLAFQSAGINTVYPAPSLNRFDPDPTVDPKVTLYGGMVLGRVPDQNGIARVSAMAIAPIRSVEAMGGRKTLWGTKTFGVHAPQKTTVGVIFFKLR